MKALLLEAPLNFKTIDIAEPAAPGPGEAVVRVHRVGICGTDLSGYLGKMPFFSYPRIPGHELGVEVLAVGEGVTNVKPGDRCAVEPYINCQKCFSCTRGHTNCCEHHQTLGVHCDGGLRPQFTVPARKLHISTKLEYEQLALVETLAIGCHAVNRCNPKPGEWVLIIGAGPIGLSALEFVKLTGANIIVMDLSEQRLDFVRTSMGVTNTIQVKGDGSELTQLTELTEGKLAQVVIDATGNNRSMSGALQYVGFAGRLVFVGITTQEISFVHPLMHRREMTLLASRNALSADFSRIVSLIENGQIDTNPWITHRPAFADVAGIFPSLTKPETGCIKAIVDVGE
ncbi:Alcohol dehydrogenase GroES domain protein [Pirellula staleyi DSM 6068]|uniref:Alcohol dehydrogenase GroES domain protein n=1 Tax=Pirellula staleyi (strain ATCC 27377 / DSM 6068 / ICPB 4128) TaxID=530564 RepID=D2R7D0_PIRSD|nr:zinc-binding alcohol dehydrogenase family protein [Pirellula staleyi]ADB15626.1 Alcohol dehydrogenase GroES domain protein [Pirellula staleyi DSM 6068]